MQIDWTLLILLVVAALGVLGLVLALQTAGGRRRLADVAMRLAEALLAYAIRWLESIAPDQPGVAMAEPHDLARARAAQICLRSTAVREIQVPDGKA